MFVPAVNCSHPSIFWTKNRGMPRIFTTPEQLGRRIKNSRDVLEENGWMFVHQKENAKKAKRHWFVKLFDMAD